MRPSRFVRSVLLSWNSVCTRDVCDQIEKMVKHREQKKLLALLGLRSRGLGRRSKLCVNCLQGWSSLVVAVGRLNIVRIVICEPLRIVSAPSQICELQGCSSPVLAIGRMNFVRIVSCDPEMSL